MITKKRSIKGFFLLLAAATMITAGCANKAKNQVSQQGVQRQEVQNQPQANVDNRIRIANEAVDKIVKLKGVKQANVLVTGNNAYVAAVLDSNQGQLTPELEDQIAKQVRSTEPAIQNVYVSTNPDFVERVNRYVTDVREGRPVSGFIEQFNELVRRVFPKAR